MNNRFEKYLNIGAIDEILRTVEIVYNKEKHLYTQETQLQGRRGEIAKQKLIELENDYSEFVDEIKSNDADEKYSKAIESLILEEKYEEALRKMSFSKIPFASKIFYKAAIEIKKGDYNLAKMYLLQAAENAPDDFRIMIAVDKVLKDNRALSLLGEEGYKKVYKYGKLD